METSRTLRRNIFAPSPSIHTNNNQRAQKKPPSHITLISHDDSRIGEYSQICRNHSLNVKSFTNDDNKISIEEFFFSLKESGNINNRSHIIIDCHGEFIGDEHFTYIFEHQRIRTVDLLKAIRRPGPLGVCCSATIYLTQCHSGDKRLSHELCRRDLIKNNGACVILSSSKVSFDTACQKMIGVLVQEIRYAQDNDLYMPEPEELFTRIGAFRSTCITLISDNLSGPITLHKPQSTDEMGPAGLKKTAKDVVPPEPKLKTKEVADKTEDIDLIKIIDDFIYEIDNNVSQKASIAPKPIQKPRIEGNEFDVRFIKSTIRNQKGISITDIETEIRHQGHELHALLIANSSSDSIDKFYGMKYFTDFDGGAILAIQYLLGIVTRNKEKHEAKGQDWLYKQLRDVGYGAARAIEFDIVKNAFSAYSPETAIFACHELGVDGNSRDANGETALMYALRELPLSVARALIEDNGSLLVFDKSRNSPITIARNRSKMSRQRPVTRFVYQNLFNELDAIFRAPGRQNSEKRQLIIAKKFEELVTNLRLSRVPFTEICSDGGWNIIHTFAFCGYDAHIEIALRMMKGDLLKADLNGMSPLDVAMSCGHKKAADVIRNAIATRKPSEAASSQNNAEG